MSDIETKNNAENSGAGTELVVQTNVEGLKDLADQLSKLHQRMFNVVWDCKTTAGDKQARRDRKDLVSTRTALTARAAELKRSLKASLAKQIEEIDTDADKMVAFVKRYEDPLDELITADEARRTAEKKAREDAETERTAVLRERVAEISAVATRAVGLDSVGVKAKLDLVTRLPVGDDFEEFKPHAVNAKAEAILTLQGLLDAALAAEEKAAEAQRNAERLAQLEKENAERLERETAERTAREAREAAERKAADEQRDRQQAEERARQAQIERAANLITMITKLMKRAQSASAHDLLEWATELESIGTKADLGASQAAVDAERAQAIAEVHDLHKAAVAREEQQRVAAAADAREKLAIGEIESIRGQAVIAQVGRLPHTRPRNIDDVKVLIADTAAWPITVERFGRFFATAEDARDAQVAKLRNILAELEAERDAMKDEVVVVDTGSKSIAIEPIRDGAVSGTVYVEAQVGPRTAFASEESLSGFFEPGVITRVSGPNDLAIESAQPVDADFLQVPVFDNFRDERPIGWLRLRHDALPATPDFVFSLAFVAELKLLDGPPGTVPHSPYIGPYTLTAICPQTDDGYIAYQQQIGRVPTNERISALELVVGAVSALMKAATPSKVRKGAAGPWIVPLPQMNELKAALRAVPLPGGQFYAEDGTLMNADGTRSVFDDVAE